jgi:hypothetical protein
MEGLAMNVWTPRGEAEKRPQRVAIDNNSIIARQRRSCPAQPGQSRRGGVTNSNEAERLQWVALTVLGLVAGLALALPLGVPIFAIVGAMAGTPIVLGIVGLGLGTAQWPIIRRHMSSSWWWVVVSALGMALGLTAGVILVEQVGRVMIGGQVNFRMLGVAARAASFGTIGVMGGGALGLAQWLVLRRHAPRCGGWIRINTWSLGAGLACGSLLADALVARSGSLASTVILLVIGSAVAGASTAKALSEIFPPGAQHVSATGR